MSDARFEITSPLMGTFYRSSGPGEPPLIKEGQKVNAEDVVCVIESMKIFTELRTPHAGTILKIVAQNEDMVMKGQALIEIEKD